MFTVEERRERSRGSVETVAAARMQSRLSLFKVQFQDSTKYREMCIKQVQIILNERVEDAVDRQIVWLCRQASIRMLCAAGGMKR